MWVVGFLLLLAVPNKKITQNGDIWNSVIHCSDLINHKSIYTMSILCAFADDFLHHLVWTILPTGLILVSNRR